MKWGDILQTTHSRVPYNMCGQDVLSDSFVVKEHLHLEWLQYYNIIRKDCFQKNPNLLLKVILQNT
jgi:hypothetical protein